MSGQLFKSLLSHEFYVKYGDFITQEFFPRELHPVFNTLVKAHEKYNTDITTDELKELHFSNNPTMTTSSKDSVTEVLDILDETHEYNPDIAKDIIVASWKSEVCRRIIEHTAALESGTSTDWDKLTELQSSLSRLPSDVSDEDYDNISLDTLNEYMNAEQHFGKWKFNIPELQAKTTGLHEVSFTIVGARPEVGKTALYTGLCAAPEGFIHQGAKVSVWRNEEDAGMLARRFASAILQEPSNRIHSNLDKFKKIIEGVDGTLNILKDDVTLNKSLRDIDAYLNNVECDILILDQIDNMLVDGRDPTGDVNLIDRLYKDCRKLSMKYKVSIIAFTQAGTGADGKLHFGYNELYGSKTAKAATADTILTIGAMRDERDGSDNGVRMINYAKNKFGGPQDATMAKLNHEVSTYVEDNRV